MEGDLAGKGRVIFPPHFSSPPGHGRLFDNCLNWLERNCFSFEQTPAEMKENCTILRLWGRKEEGRAGLCKITLCLRKSRGFNCLHPHWAWAEEDEPGLSWRRVSVASAIAGSLEQLLMLTGVTQCSVGWQRPPRIAPLVPATGPVLPPAIHSYLDATEHRPRAGHLRPKDFQCCPSSPACRG